MDTANKFRAMMHAEMKIPARMRHEFVWYMNEATVREFSRSACNGWPEDKPLPEGIQMFGIAVEIVESREILLVMKVA